MIVLFGNDIKEKYFKNDGPIEPKTNCCCVSAPQIRYPDCYGIDMANLKD